LVNAIFDIAGQCGGYLVRNGDIEGLCHILNAILHRRSNYHTPGLLV
jgi:hypothetical protein